MPRSAPKAAAQAAKDEVTYFFLIRDTEKGAVVSTAQRKSEINSITKVVRQEGGQCQLYSTRGAPCDFVSVITGISAAAAIRIAAEIEMRGNVKATLIPGLEFFNAP
jgi:uncharacterized protein with GYD domain